MEEIEEDIPASVNEYTYWFHELHHGYRRMSLLGSQLKMPFDLLLKCSLMK